jgi:hypothetical protein
MSFTTRILTILTRRRPPTATERRETAMAALDRILADSAAATGQREADGRTYLKLHTAAPITPAEAGILYNGNTVETWEGIALPDGTVFYVTEPEELGAGGPYLFDDPDPDA